MSIRVSFPALLSERIGGIGSVEVEGESVESALRSLTERHAALTSLVWREGRVNPLLAIFVNGHQLAPDQMWTRLSSGDEVVVVPAIEGGQRRGPGSGRWRGRGRIRS